MNGKSAKRFASWSDRPSRRLILGGLAASPALSGCAGLIESAIDSCPDDPAESGGINWIPDVAHPVFFGVQDLSPADGAPRPMLIYYPAHRFRAPPVLKLGFARWPVVLFLHGQGTTHREWWRLPSTLARCGYVVVAPNHNEQLVIGDPDRAVAEAMRDIDWVRNEWSEAQWVDKRPTSTVVAGHSFGALLAVQVAAAHPMGALVSLGGPFQGETRSIVALRSVTAPSFLMWAKGGIGEVFEDLDQGMFWDQQLAQDKYAAVYQGDHFDYVEAGDSGSAPRGPCPHIGGAAGDLATLFIASNIASLTQVGIDLRKPQVQLTPQQEVYAGGHLNNLDLFNVPGCRLDLRWNVGGVTGARQFGL